MPFFDSHCHLVFDPENHSPQEQLERARGMNVGMMLCVAVDLESAIACRLLAEQEPDVLASVGIHPNDCGPEDNLSEKLEALKHLARTGGWAAIGETGMDFYRDNTSPDIQEKSFKSHLDLAEELNLPIIIHCRHAASKVLDILRNQNRTVRGVMHCWSEDPKFVKPILDIGLHFSFAGNLTYPKANLIKDSVSLIPSERLLIETDAPFLAPQPVRGQKNEPAHIHHTLEAIAEIRGETREALEQSTWKAAESLFSAG